MQQSFFSYVTTCQLGVESLVRNDQQRLGLQQFEVENRLIRSRGTLEDAYRMLVSNRFANRIYIELARAKVTDFDALFSQVAQIPWKQYLPNTIRVVTEAMSTKSVLSHTPTIQSIAKKAIHESFPDLQDHKNKEIHIQIFLRENILQVLLDITGAPLHQRGYRKQAGEAPIKENLAAALVALSGWKFAATLYDPMCGSGTIAIEAAMLARNIPPGISRDFAIMHLPFFDETVFQEIRKEAQATIYPSGKYRIFATDKDPNMIDIARKNAEKAGVLEDIVFSVGDIVAGDWKQEQPYWIVSNPPYGTRLQDVDLQELYRIFANIFSHSSANGGIITSYEPWKTLIDTKQWKNRKLYNGSLLTYFWIKKH